MAKENIRKIKVLKLLEHLRLNTDENHPLSAGEIAADLATIGVTFDPRTISQDIVVLNELGYEVMSTMVGHQKRYYIEDRSFSVPELKILIDAVQAASFITDKKTQELIDKIAVLGGSHRAEILKGNLVCFNTRKHSNEHIYYNVDTLEKAIQTNKKVIFYYFDLDENRKKVYRREHHHYVVEPIALVFNEDNYYLISYSSKHNNIANYRVDRMEEVEVIDDNISDKAIMLRNDIPGYTEQIFKMYSGSTIEVKLEFDNSLIGVIYDKFGESVKMSRINEKYCSASVQVQVSPVFWGWLFQFSGHMRIISPESLRVEYKERCKKAYCY